MIKRVHPDLQGLLDVFPPLNFDYLDAVREGMASSPTPPIADDINVADQMINGPNGDPLRVRIYKLESETNNSACIVVDTWWRLCNGRTRR